MNAPSDRVAPRWITALVALIAVLVPVLLYAVFVVAPVEARMGIVQKIFYIHVPSANAMYLGFIVAAVGSAVYLAKRDPRWDAIAVAGAEVGMLFCAIVLVTGPLWARKAWGVYWTWDPRLTSTMLAGMIFTAYIALRSFGTTGEAERRFAAALAIIGLLDLPIIKYSVQRWRGTHPTVISGRGGGIHPDMVPALLIGLVTIALLAVVLIALRYRVERTRQQLHAIEIEVARRGLLEEGA